MSKTTKINAEGVALGRLASQVAVSLRGKDRPEYEPHIDGKFAVLVENVDKLKVTGRKMDDKNYYTHSGYPGGLKTKKMKDIVVRKGYSEIVRIAVRNMLPKNRLRSDMMKRLTFKNSK